MGTVSEQLRIIRDYFQRDKLNLNMLEKIRYVESDGDDQYGWSEDYFRELLESPMFATEFPEKLLDRKFKDILKPFLFKGGSKTIYGKLQASDEAEGTFVFSACTEEMREADEAFFREKNSERPYNVLDILYKPYFYELSVEKSGLNSTFEEGIWYKIGIKKKYKENEKDIENKGDTWHSEEDGREWIENQVCAHLTFGASPLGSKTVYIEWYKKLEGNVEFPSEYAIVSAGIQSNAVWSAVDAEMHKMFKGAITTDLRVYRVGQANFIYGCNTIGSQEKCFAFDIGLPTDANLYREENGKVNKNESGIFDDGILGSISLELIIISHWHQDHYKGAYVLCRDMYRKATAPSWIAPIYGSARSSKPKDKCYNVDRLIAYLLKLGKIFFVPINYVYQEGNYVLCRGIGADINNQGLLLQLSRTLLPGDCACECWPSKYATLSKADCIVVPHHGSKNFNKNNMQTRLASKINTNCKAIICVGKHNKHGHPSEDAKVFYQHTLHCAEIIQTKDVQNPLDTWIMNP